MADFLISTTGTLSPVVLSDLGNRTFTHPTVNHNLTAEYSREEISRSVSLGTALDSGWITATYEGIDITSSADIEVVGAGDMARAVYDPDADDIIDKSETLDDGTGNVVTASQARTHLDDTSNPHSVDLEQARTVGNTLSGDINANGNTITGLIDPTGSSEAATKNYVDTLIGSHNHDPRYPRIYTNAGNPNGTVSGKMGDYCKDTTNSINYVCEVAGTANWAVQ